jgi:phosphonate degradation associated HDIG domain protein
MMAPSMSTAIRLPRSPSMDIVHQIEELFELHGHTRYEGAREEPVTARAHALQCAQLAEWADAPTALVAAALLHDIGHFLAPEPGTDAIDDVHELRALGFLKAGFDDDVVEPVRLHVQAKRYLVSVDAHYAATLSPASTHTLALQGGPMSADERRWFEALPHAGEAVALRRWDDLAKEPGRRTPPLGYYLALVASLCAHRAAPGGVGIGRPAGAWPRDSSRVSAPLPPAGAESAAAAHAPARCSATRRR